MASPNHEDHLEFFSIKVPGGPLTSKLQHIKDGDQIVIGQKPTGTLVLDNLLPGKTLYLLATGTGLAPFLSLIRDLETYERFERVVLMHGCRFITDLAYSHYLTKVLPEDEVFGELVREKLIYYPSVTREPFRHVGRITHHLQRTEFFAEIGRTPLSPETDRVMLCGSPQMIQDLRGLIEGFGLAAKVGIFNVLAGDHSYGNVAKDADPMAQDPLVEGTQACLRKSPHPINKLIQRTGRKGRTEGRHVPERPS
jgi:ferredoxin--NADP+ reductase